MNPMRPRKIPLRTKTFLVVTTGLILCTAALTTMQYRLATRTLMTEWESKAVGYGRLMAFSFQSLLEGRDRPSDVAEAVSQALLIPGVKSITVVDAQGIIVADSKGEPPGSRFAIHLDALRRALNDETDTGISWIETKESGRVRYLLMPMKSRAADSPVHAPTQGVVLIGLDLSAADVLVESHVHDLLSLNGMMFVVLLLMFWITIRIGLVQPLHHLAKTVRLAPGADALSDVPPSSDEIAGLSEDFARMNDALQESEAFTRATLNSLPMHAAVLDKDGHLLAVNASWEKFARDHGDLFPYTGGGLVNFLEVSRTSATGYGAYTQEAVAGIRGVLNGHTLQFTLEYMSPLPNDRRWFLLSVSPLQRQQGGVILSHTDVTERRRAEDALLKGMMETERAHARLDTLYATIPIGLMYITPALVIERVTQSMAQMHGRSAAELVNEQLSQILPAERWARIKPVLEHVITTGTAYHELEEVISDPRRPDGLRMLLSHYHPELKEDGTVSGIHISTQDITTEKQAQREHEQNLKALKAKNRELDQMAIRDPLTGLYNRRFFDEALSREWQQFQRSGEAFTVMIMDVDAFKAINDDHGHEAGDRALQQVSITLKTHLRESDLIARVGGDEFAALLPRTDTEQSRQVVEKLGDVLQALRLATADGDIPMSLSLGTATVPGFPPVTSAAELLRVADKRMYEAKRLTSARRADAG